MGKFLRFYFITFCILILLSACDYKGPAEIYIENQPSGKSPVILSVEPPDSAISGITEIHLIGEGFSSISDSNLVYINHQQVELKEVSPTLIKVYRPNMVGDSLMIQVLVPSALDIGEYGPYKLAQVTFEHGDFESGGIGKTYGIAVDSDENVYVASRKIIYKVTPDGERTDLVKTDFSNLDNMMIGPDGYLYMVRGKKDVYRVNTISPGDVETFVKVPENVDVCDFDENKNLFVAGKKGLFAVQPDGSQKTVGQFEGGDYDINSLRVFAGSIYTIVEYNGDDTSIPQHGIWKSQILNGTGELGGKELVFDWTQADDFANSTMSSITFAEDGDMYVGMSDDPTYPILVIHSDNTYEPLYHDSTILMVIADQIVWGNGLSGYINRGISSTSGIKIVRIGMGKPGAPYFGRD